MKAAWGDSDGSPSLLAGLGLVARLWGLTVPRWGHCWVVVELQPWHSCCWDQESSGQDLADQPSFTSALQPILAMLPWHHKGKRQECWENTESCEIKRGQEDESPQEVVIGRGTSHATEIKDHEAVWVHQLLRSCSWCVLIDTPIRGRWGHTVHAGEVHVQTGCKLWTFVWRVGQREITLRSDTQW